MKNRFASIALAIALVCTIGGTSAFANTPTKTEPGTKVTETLPDPPTAAKTEAQPNEKLKAGLAKLLADTKAGRGKLSAQPQTQTARGNNLSKRTKIALGV